MTAGGERPKRYRGELKERIPLLYLGSQMSDPGYEAAFASKNEEILNRERLRKLDLLMEHYGIVDRSDFKALALALSVDHVPGFGCKRVRMKLGQGDFGALVNGEETEIGRPVEWSEERLAKLLATVEAEKQRDTRQTDRSVLAKLARRPPWSATGTHRGTSTQWIETLQARLHDAKVQKRAQHAHDKAAESMIEKIEIARMSLKK